MKPRMLCTDCFSVAHADTLLPGSDAVEMLAWLCFGLPGWLYCWWRHVLRIKVCAHCGSTALVREARAAAALRPPQLAGRTRVENLEGPVRWPAALRTPRERLRRGAAVVALWAATLSTWALASAGVLPAVAVTTALPALALTATAWVGRQAVHVARVQASLASCRAWDQRGRPLHVEVL